MSKKKILIVEDERIIAEDIKQTLTRLGYEVTGIASSSQKALEMADANIPDLAVMDIILQGKKDGITIANRLRERFDIPAIYLTAYADKEILRRAKISSPYGYILKPFDERELHINVEIALERSSAKRLLRRTNAVLKTVRNINQLIVREEEAGTLIKSACQILTEEGTYPRSWIVLLDKEGQMTANAQSGWGKKFQLLKKLLKEDKVPDCGGKALHSKKVIISRGSSHCNNCPFHKYYPEYDNLTIALRSHGEIYGLMSVALAGKNHVSKEEADLFRELAGDVAFALHNMELEEQRRQLNETLQKSESFLKGVLTSIQDGICVLNPDLTIWYVNDVMNEWYSENLPLEGNKCFQCYHNTSQPCDPCPSLRCIESGKTESNIVPGLPGSSVEWLELHSYPVKDPTTGAVTGIVEFVRDITERKQAEEALMESEERIRTVVEASKDAIVAVNDQAKVIIFNQAADQMFGQSAEEMIGGRLDRIIPKDKAHQHNRTLIGFLANGVSRCGHINRTMEQEAVRADGTLFPIEISLSAGRANGNRMMVAVIRDITERKLAEEKLRESEERFRTIFESEPECVKLLDENGMVLRMNPAGLKMVDADTPDQVEGKSVYPLISSGYRSVFKAFNAKVLQGESGIMEFEIVGLKGNHRLLETHAVPIRNIKGEVTTILAVTRDITERKQAEERENAHKHRIIALNEASRTLAATLKFQDVADKCAAIARELVDVDGASIFLLNNERTHLIPIVSKGQYSDEVMSMTLKLGEGITGHVAETGQAEIVNRVDLTERGKVIPGTPTEPESLLCAPLKLKDQVIGVVTLNRLAEREFLEEDLIFLENLANICATVIENARLYESLHESEESYRGLYDHASDAIYIQDREGRFLDVNQGAVDMYGYPKEFFIGKTPEPLAAPDKNDMEQLSKFIEQAFEGEPQQFEFWGKRKNGEVFPKFVRLNKSQYFGKEAIIAFALDISEQKQAEEELRYSEERYRSVLENIEEGYYEVDLKGNFTFFNDSLFKMLNYSHEELMGMNYRKYMESEGANRVYKAFNKVYKTEDLSKTIDFKIKRKEGEINSGEISISLMKDRNNQPIGFRGIVRDITERKHAEEELKEKMEQINRSNKLMVGRELKMIKLKREVNKLMEKAGEPKKYTSPDEVE